MYITRIRKPSHFQINLTLNKMTSLTAVIPKLYQEYTTKTPKKLKIIDAYLLYIFLTAVIQFAYCCLVGTFPFNSFLSGFISTVSSFVLAGKPMSIFFGFYYISKKHNLTCDQHPLMPVDIYFFCPFRWVII